MSKTNLKCSPIEALAIVAEQIRKCCPRGGPGGSELPDWADTLAWWIDGVVRENSTCIVYDPPPIDCNHPECKSFTKGLAQEVDRLSSLLERSDRHSKAMADGANYALSKFGDDYSSRLDKLCSAVASYESWAEENKRGIEAKCLKDSQKNCCCPKCSYDTPCFSCGITPCEYDYLNKSYCSLECVDHERS